jgi:hypothetical protein
MNFREANETGIGQGHRPVAIAMHERPDIRLLLLHSERDANHASLDQFKERVGIMAIAFQKKRRLGKDRFARQERRPQPLPLLDRPRVVSHAGSKKANQGAGIQQARAFVHRPKPAM